MTSQNDGLPRESSGVAGDNSEFNTVDCRQEGAVESREEE